MDCKKFGDLLARLRQEKLLTQQQLADLLGVSNKTVSKWECGNGYPDVLFWQDLANILGADIAKLLQGDLIPNRRDTGNLEKIRFYRCEHCENIVSGTGGAEVFCCGRSLSSLPVSAPLQGHEIFVKEMDIEYYISLEHEMTREHYIVFAALVYNDKILFIRLYPEQNAAFSVPLSMGYGSLYVFCSQHGLQKFRFSGVRRPPMRSEPPKDV